MSRIISFVREFERQLWVLSFGWFVSALGFAISIPFIAIYFNSQLGFSLSEIGIFFGVLAIIRSTFQLVGGELADRVERRLLLIYAQLFRSLAFLFLGVSIANDWGFWPVAASLVVTSIFGAVFQPAAQALVSDILPREKRLDGYAITRAAGNLGWAVGPALGGFLASTSYSLLFFISAIITALSALIFQIWFVSPLAESPGDRFSFKDLLSIGNYPFLPQHCALIFILYLVVAQLMAPFSVYAVTVGGLSELELGYIYTVNGLMVALLQIPITRILSKQSFTAQLAWGGLIYAIGYGLIGTFVGFWYFVLAIGIVTVGEMLMSPPSLALTSRLAPPGRMGRYMGIFGFFVASGWSFGPLYGGLILDHFSHSPAVAWLSISSLALVSATGYLLFKRQLPDKYNFKE